MRARERAAVPSRFADDPVAVERVSAAVSDTESLTTVTDLAIVTDLPGPRTLKAVAVLLDSGTVRAVRRPDGRLGFAPVHKSTETTETETESERDAERRREKP